MVEIKRDKCLIIIRCVSQLKPAQLRKILKLASVDKTENDRVAIKTGLLDMLSDEESEIIKDSEWRLPKFAKSDLNKIDKLRGVVNQWDI